MADAIADIISRKFKDFIYKMSYNGAPPQRSLSCLTPLSGFILVSTCYLHSLLLSRLKCQICDACQFGPSVARCPFRGHISKTEQDRPIVQLLWNSIWSWTADHPVDAL